MSIFIFFFILHMFGFFQYLFCPFFRFHF